MSGIWLILLLGFSTVAVTEPGEWISLGGGDGEAPEISLLHSSAEGLVLSVELPGFRMTDMPGNGEIFQRIELPDCPCDWKIPGLPEVPVVPSLIGIPFGREAVITSVETETVEFTGIKLYPVQEPTTDTDTHSGVFVLDEEAYGSSEPWPSESALMNMPGTWSGVDVERLVVQPFRYTASEQILEVARRVTVHVSFEGEGEAQHPVSPAIQRMHRSMIINYDALCIPEAGNTDQTDPVYIVITTEANLDPITPLLHLDNIMGNHVHIEVLAELSTSAQIKAAISENYVSGVTRFVIIVGRHQVLPSHNFGSFYGDYYYSELEGDYYPDVGIGRISEIADEIPNQVDKIISYMSHTGTSGELPVPATSALCAHEEGYPGKYTANKNAIAAEPYSFINMVFYKYYPPEGATAEDVAERINEGIGTVNYRGHGSVTSWQWSPGWNTGRIYGLTNTFYPPVFNIACNNGDHTKTYNCLCESWMDAEGKGASGAFGASSASNTQANNRLDRAIYWAFYEHNVSHSGEAMEWAITDMIETLGGLGLNNARMYHWFGDPAQDIFNSDEIGAPYALILSGNTTMNPGSQNQTYTVMSEGSPVAGVTVTASDGTGNHPDNPENFWIQGTTNSSGQATLNFNAIEGEVISIGAYMHNYAFDTMSVPVYPTGIQDGTIVQELFLSSPAPNPCRSQTSVDYTLASTGPAELAVFDLSGRMTAVLTSGFQTEGAHSAVWNTQETPSGIYFIRLSTQNGMVTRRIMVAR